MLNTLETYNSAWTDLNAALRAREAATGLGGVISALEENQRQTGFIKDQLSGVERHVFSHPDDVSLFFRVQFNAKRLARFNGAGVSAPPEGLVAAHDGCFLCRENVMWQQQGAELGYALDVNGQPFHAWMNPFPLLPSHVVMASAIHETQEWAYAPDGGVQIKRVVRDLVSLASRMPSYLGFYNGVNAGASIPGHLHYQFFKRPEDGADFPLEARLRGRNDEGDAPIIAADYPVPVVKWTGAPDEVVDAAVRWINHWAAQNEDRIYRLTANIIVSAGPEGDVDLYFVPRDRTRNRGKAMSGLVGGLELLGEVVMSSPEERHALDNGEIDYFIIENILSSVRTPLFAQLDAKAAAS